MAEDARPETGIHLPLPDDTLHKLHSIVQPFLLTTAQETRLREALREEMKRGLSRHESQRKQSCLQMENTYVRGVLDGSEQGDFLALDLGGTNFRVLMCRMRQGKCESVSRNYNVPKPKLHGPAVDVFDHLAESIYLFLKEEGDLDRRLPLGFTFSFPMTQDSIKSGILVTWTKSFACPDGVGQDAVKLLEEAIARRGDINVDVVAILNDTTGTLLAGSYLDRQCYIGLIMGTGCNAAYMESLHNVDKWTGLKDGPKQVIIDTECGAFGDNGCLDFLKTEFDSLIDMHSNWPGSFTFEKMFGGHYIGDLARLVLLRLAEDDVFCAGHVSEKLREWGSFTAKHLSGICADSGDSSHNTAAALDALCLSAVATAGDVAIVQHVCHAISVRAAQLVAGVLAQLLLHMKRPECTIAIDGSLYKYHPYLHDRMTEKITEIVPDTKFKLILAEDGSGRGAAFVAAVAARINTH